MTPRVASFLRAINVGGRNVTMERLREAFDGIGLGPVQTFIASGNVVLEAPDADLAALETRIEVGLAAALGYEVPSFVREVSRLGAIASVPPFSAEEVGAAGAVNVAFLKAPLDASQVERLAGLCTEVDQLRAEDCEVYWLCAVRQSESKLANAGIERALGVASTMRGISTIRRMADRYA